MTATLSGTVALVAGGTGGLGRSVSMAFLQEGANVIVTYRRPEEFDLLKGEADVGIQASQRRVLNAPHLSLPLRTPGAGGGSRRETGDCPPP